MIVENYDTRIKSREINAKQNKKNMNEDYDVSKKSQQMNEFK